MTDDVLHSYSAPGGDAGTVTGDTAVAERYLNLFFRT